MPIKGKHFKKNPYYEVISCRCPIGTRKAIEKRSLNTSEFVRDLILRELKD